MAKKIRWDWIHGQYRVGLGIREISRLHEAEFGFYVSESAIRKRRDLEGWKRDLLDDVAAERSRFKSAQSAQKSAQGTHGQIVEEAAVRTASVLDSHQKVLQELRTQCHDLLGFNSIIIATLKEEQQLASLLRDAKESMEQKRFRVATTMKMVGALQSNLATASMSAARFIPLERVAHGMADEVESSDAGPFIPNSEDAQTIILLAAEEIQHKRCS